MLTLELTNTPARAELVARRLYTNGTHEVGVARSTNLAGNPDPNATIRLPAF